MLRISWTKNYTNLPISQWDSWHADTARKKNGLHYLETATDLYYNLVVQFPNYLTIHGLEWFVVM